MEKEKISEFYDLYTKYQVSTRNNIRHRTIFLLLKKFGLKRNSNILEVGCGIGTVTYLLARYAKKGTIVATDISAKSIDIAKNTICKGLQHIDFVITDMKDFRYEKLKFDFVVLPDVLEHIPKEEHDRLFEIFNRHTHENSKIFIHIPSPFYQRWAFKHKKEALQIIDLDLDSNHIIELAYKHDFSLRLMNTYSLFTKEGDYQYFLFEKGARKEHQAVNYFPYHQRLIRELHSRIMVAIEQFL
ncbi:MAG: class I SAM-dependent methyltransferase [Bacteroidia bacterium]|nr:class I SAM-dependent methyltransferase [Bacteroidia bacterium]